MSPEYIIVQAGGKGTRMEYLTENKPKALVPIGNLPMLFHLFKKYPKQKYLIISDYKIDIMRKYLAAFASVNYLIIDTHGKKGTCSGIRSAMRYIPDLSPFMLIWSDLVLSDDFELPDKIGDYVGLSKDFRCRWRYEDNLFNEIPSEDTGVAGFFLFKDKRKLMHVPAEGELVKWMQSQRQTYHTVDLYRTKEYGQISTWNNLADNRTDSKCRPFNRMLVDHNRIIKEGIDEQGNALAIKEKAWYQFVAERGFTKMPRIYSFEPLTMQKIEGHNIFMYDFSHEERKTILKDIVNALKELHSLGSAPTDYFSIKEAYFGKTFQRLQKIRDMIPFANREFIIINGKKCRNVYFYKTELEQRFEEYSCPIFKLLHGDNTFSNLMLDKDMKPVLIDPRGYFGFTQFYGDVAYDWAKLYYSIIGNYDQFNIKKFKLRISDSEVFLDIASNGWENMKGYFFELVGNDVQEQDIQLIHAVIWLSLTTYAWEDYDSICGAFYNGLRYLEEVL